MLAKRILPCLDVKAGRVVKGVNFVDLKDAGDPVELAQIYNEAGADELVFLDITATHEERDILIDVVYRTAEQVFIPLTVGGGIGNLDMIKSLLRAGADKISLNSAAVRNPDLVNRASDRFGNQCIVIAIDARRREDPANPGWDDGLCGSSVLLSGTEVGELPGSGVIVGVSTVGFGSTVGMGVSSVRGSGLGMLRACSIRCPKAVLAQPLIPTAKQQNKRGMGSFHPSEARRKAASFGADTFSGKRGITGGRVEDDR